MNGMSAEMGSSMASMQMRLAMYRATAQSDGEPIPPFVACSFSFVRSAMMFLNGPPFMKEGRYQESILDAADSQKMVSWNCSPEHMIL